MLDLNGNHAFHAMHSVHFVDQYKGQNVAVAAYNSTLSPSLAS